MKTKIKVQISGITFQGLLSTPNNGSNSLVIFVHGNGSSGYSPRNNYLSDILNNSGISTFLIDLLTVQESEIDNHTNEYRFDIKLQTERLLKITDTILQEYDSKSVKLGYFGASTGTAVAICTAIQKPDDVVTIVSRSGRPDLIEKGKLKQLKSSLLLLVGSEDTGIINLSKRTLNVLNHEWNNNLVLIPGATHLFEETGKIEQVGRIAAGWFKNQLSI